MEGLNFCLSLLMKQLDKLEYSGGVQKMAKSEIIKRVAPCSLMCHTCSAYNDGVICVSAKTLLKYLEGIKEFYEIHMPDAVEGYNNFEGDRKSVV